MPLWLFRLRVTILAAGLFLLPAGNAVRGQACPDPLSNEALRDAGAFRLGYALAQERIGFSGRILVSVFTTAEDPAWPSILDCIESGLLDSEMRFFTGALVDAAAEPEPEPVLRSQGFTVIARGLNGAFRGALEPGWTCIAFLDLLQRVRASSTVAPEPSPLYANLQERPEELIEFLVQDQGCPRATTYMAFFQEFDGDGAEAVIRAKVALFSLCRPVFLRGDVNSDGRLDISDPLAALLHLFQGVPAAICEDAADADDDGELNVTDAILLLDALFRCPPGAFPAPAPYAGLDPTEDALSCREDAA